MFGQDSNWFVSLVMPYMPLVVISLAVRDAWTRRRRQMACVPIEGGRKPWTS